MCKAVSPIHAEQVQQNLSYRHESPTMLSTSNDIKSTNQVAVSVMGENEVVSELNETRSEDQIAVSIILDDGQIVPVGKGAEVFISNLKFVWCQCVFCEKMVHVQHFLLEGHIVWCHHTYIHQNSCNFQFQFHVNSDAK